MRCRDGAQEKYAWQDAEKVRHRHRPWRVKRETCEKGATWTDWDFHLVSPVQPVSLSFMRGKAGLPTVAPVAWSILEWAVDVRAVKKWRPVDPGATQVEAESHRRIGVEGRDRLHDSGWLCQLTLQIGTRRGLAVKLIL